MIDSTSIETVSCYNCTIIESFSIHVGPSDFFQWVGSIDDWVCQNCLNDEYIFDDDCDYFHYSSQEAHDFVHQMLGQSATVCFAPGWHTEQVPVSIMYHKVNTTENFSKIHLAKQLPYLADKWQYGTLTWSIPLDDLDIAPFLAEYPDQQLFNSHIINSVSNNLYKNSSSYQLRFNLIAVCQECVSSFFPQKVEHVLLNTAYDMMHDRLNKLFSKQHFSVQDLTLFKTMLANTQHLAVSIAYKSSQ